MKKVPLILAAVFFAALLLALIAFFMPFGSNHPSPSAAAVQAIQALPRGPQPELEAPIDPSPSGQRQLRPSAPLSALTVPDQSLRKPSFDDVWSLPNRLPSAKECLGDPTYNPAKRTFSLQSRIDLQRFIQPRNNELVDLILDRQDIVGKIINDKIKAGAYWAAKPTTSVGVVKEGTLATPGGYKQVYVILLPGEDSELDRINEDILIKYPQAVSDIQAYILSM